MWEKGFRLLSNQTNPNLDGFARDALKTMLRIQDLGFVALATKSASKMIEKALNNKWNTVVSNYRTGLKQCEWNSRSSDLSIALPLASNFSFHFRCEGIFQQDKH